MKTDSVEQTLLFFQKAFPDSKPKNFRTQLGVHFEEIAEMLDTLEPTTEEDEVLFQYMSAAIKGTAEHLKTSNARINIKDRVEFLDAICDQMVTAIGAGYHAQMDVAGGFNEVNRSNASKFGEDGEPILDINLKMTKGPNYSKPDLKSYV